MPSMLAGKNIAILAADGFDEHQVTEIQKAFVREGAHSRMIAAEAGIVNGWQGDGWGHHFHVDAPISEALGSDFDMLVLPGGTRAAAKLKTNLHTRRIVNHFVEANKPITAIGAGAGLLALAAAISGRTVAAPDDAAIELKAAGVVTGMDNQEIDGNIFSAKGDNLAAWVEGTISFFSDAELVTRAA